MEYILTSNINYITFMIKILRIFAGPVKSLIFWPAKTFVFAGSAKPLVLQAPNAMRLRVCKIVDFSGIQNL